MCISTSTSTSKSLSLSIVGVAIAVAVAATATSLLVELVNHGPARHGPFGRQKGEEGELMADILGCRAITGKGCRD